MPRFSKNLQIIFCRSVATSGTKKHTNAKYVEIEEDQIVSWTNVLFTGMKSQTTYSYSPLKKLVYLRIIKIQSDDTRASLWKLKLDFEVHISGIMMPDIPFRCVVNREFFSLSQNRSIDLPSDFSPTMHFLRYLQIVYLFQENYLPTSKDYVL